MGSLRREVRATSIERSTSIEGFNTSPEEALAIACYARAMDHVGTMAEDPSFRWHDRVILDLPRWSSGWPRETSRPTS